MLFHTLENKVQRARNHRIFAYRSCEYFPVSHDRFKLKEIKQKSLFSKHKRPILALHKVISDVGTNWNVGVQFITYFTFFLQICTFVLLSLAVSVFLVDSVCLSLWQCVSFSLAVSVFLFVCILSVSVYFFIKISKLLHSTLIVFGGRAR